VRSTSGKYIQTHLSKAELVSRAEEYRRRVDSEVFEIMRLSANDS
jgi:hypothetical protein